MGGSKSKMMIMFIMLLIIFKSGWSEGCLDHERFALLRLKHFFDDSYLYDWADDEGATDCCQWENVECSNTTGRVIALDLFDTHGGEHSWYLNASLFTPFQQLESLDLTYNNIAGCVENEGASFNLINLLSPPKFKLNIKTEQLYAYSFSRQF
uniref:Receptor like protein n=1 Tax=Citrus limon TaxID=2708 RepID=A0A1S8AD12_CITLI